MKAFGSGLWALGFGFVGGMAFEELQFLLGGVLSHINHRGTETRSCTEPQVMAWLCFLAPGHVSLRNSFLRRATNGLLRF